MNEEGKERFDTSMRDYLRARVSRAQALKAAGIAMAAAAIPGAASAAASGDYPTPSTPAGALSLPFYPQVQGT